MMDGEAEPASETLRAAPLQIAELDEPIRGTGWNLQARHWP